MRRHQSLFWGKDLQQVLSFRLRDLHDDIDSLTDDEALANDEDLLVENYYAKYEMEPLVIDDEDVTKRSLGRAIVTITDTFRYNIDGPTEVDGFEASFSYPFSGDPSLFECRASTFSTSGYPDAEILGSFIRLSYAYPVDELRGADAVDKFLKRAQGDLATLRCGASYVNADLERFNSELRGWTEKWVKERRDKADLFGCLARTMEIPIKPSPYREHAVRMERRIMPIAHSYDNEDYWQISDRQYEDILSVIRHTSATFERTPDTYAGFGEEDYRNVLLAGLNGNFHGAAGGECFRGNGKTDICIEQENRAAFVAECKIWKGPAKLRKAIRQLDGYLTWRDSKASLIVFSKNKDFNSVVSSVRACLEKDELFRSLQEITKNEFDCVFASETNVGQLLRMRVFAFDVHGRPQAR
mgnify:FL=1